MELWIDRRYVPAGYGWSFPAGDELRIGVGSFDPRFHVKDTTVLLAEDLEQDPVRYQGNWIPHRLRAASDDGIFFVGDSAGHCLPLTAGSRTALYFGIACGRELRDVVDGRQTTAQALVRYGDFLGLLSPLEVRVHARRPASRAPGAAAPAQPGNRGDGLEALRRPGPSAYLAIAPPEFAGAARPPVAPRVAERAAA